LFFRSGSLDLEARAVESCDHVMRHPNGSFDCPVPDRRIASENIIRNIDADLSIHTALIAERHRYWGTEDNFTHGELFKPLPVLAHPGGVVLERIGQDRDRRERRR
jgi:hypothetical protein